MLQEKREYKILPSLVLIVIGIFIITAVSAWTSPTIAPPGGNVSSPINVGATAQTKTGGFGTLGGIVAGLDIQTNGLFYESGVRMQKRVSGTCGAGSSIREIDANGNVTCEVDTDTDTDTDTDNQVLSCGQFEGWGNDWTDVNCVWGTLTGGGCDAYTGPFIFRTSQPNGNGWRCGGHLSKKHVWAICCNLAN